MKEMKILFIVMFLGIFVATAWDAFPVIKTSVHTVLDPVFGKLMNFNLNIGFIIIVSLFNLVTLLVQKHATDQDTLKTIKEEQKIVQEELKAYKSNPDKQIELSKKSMDLQMKAMPITMRPVMYTTVPFILTFRWFADYFLTVNTKLLFVFTPMKNFLFPHWVWAYLIISILISSQLRKILKVY